MRRSAFLSLLALALAMPAAAQGPGAMPQRGPGGPGGPPMGAGPGPQAAEMLLAQTGELKLTDAQVVRLAAIARRAADRRQAMRASLEANRPAPGRQQPPSEAEMQRVRQAMEQAREQQRADLRDALAVLTPDQQAMAFERLSARRGPGGPGQMQGMRRMQGMRGMQRREGGRSGAPGDVRERRPAPPGQGAPPPPPQPEM